MSRRRDALRRLFPEQALRRDIEEELRFHLEERTRELTESGVAPAEARARVLAAFGDPARIESECRRIGGQGLSRTRRRELVIGLARELRVAARRLRRSPAFSAAALGILALGIGASVAMFSVLYEVLLRPLPYAEPERLVAVWPTKNFNAAMVEFFEAETPALGRVAGASGWTFTLLGDGPPEQVSGEVVSPDYFEVLGVRPALGRGFAREEAWPGRSGVVVLSHGFWQRRFGGDTDILGRELRLETHNRPSTHRVVGVMPESFVAPAGSPELWAPLQLAPGRTVASDSSWFVSRVVARLAPGASVQEASAQVAATAVRLRQAFPVAADEEEVRQAGVAVLLDELVGGVRPLLWAVLGAVGLVLLIACANLSTLLLARCAGDRPETAVRAALGGGRARLAGERMVESGLLGTLGGLLGVGGAWVLLRLLSGGLAAALPRGSDVALSLPVLAFALGLTLVTVLLFGVLPALRVAGQDPGAALRGGVRPGAGTRHGLDRALLAGEVALTVVLLAGALLALRSFRALAATDPGFRTQGITALHVDPAPSRLATDAARRAFYRQVEERLAEVPGTRSVGAIHLLPHAGANWSFPYLAEGHPPPENAPLPSADFRVVTPSYFPTAGVPLLRGRAFDSEDGPDSEPVIVINRTMAELLWPGEDALGREIRIFGSNPTRVVGVVGDTRAHALDLAPRPTMYVPFRQYALASLVFMVQGAPDAPPSPAVLRQAVWSVDDGVAIPFVRPLEEVLADGLRARAFFVTLLTGFGALALLLAGFGVYGVTTYLVSRRIPEFGLRLALGARPDQVVRGALRWGLSPVALGAAVGLLGALAGTRFLESLLYQVTATDPLSLGGAVTLLFAVAVGATLVPARRAARLDPSRALRSG